VALDNVFRGGDVLDDDPDDPSVRVIQDLNRDLRTDQRVHLSMLPIADGVTLALKR
jgi:caffeoyl-CoA O-methyltransferase